MASGYERAVDDLLGYEAVEDPVPMPLSDLKGGKNDRVNIQSVVAWWTARLVTTRRPLQEKMTVFWHDHFATSASKVNGPLLMAQQNETLRKNATGNFRTLLQEVSQDPAMLFWLDNQENVKGKPNENFAREVMELFTLGIGHYSEKDVQEAARAFTGWAFRRRRDAEAGGAVADYTIRPALHDDGPKSFLGQTGNLSGEDVLNILCDQPRCAEFLTDKILKWFVRPDPSQATVRKFAKVFTDHKLEIKPLLREIMLSNEFADSARMVVKSPVDFVIPTLRQIGVGDLFVRNADLPPRRRLAPAAIAAQSMRAMGMSLLFPPDVSGWRTGQSWITSATMVERLRWADRLPKPLMARQISATEPEQIVDRLVTVLDAVVPKSKMPILTKAAEEGLQTGRPTAILAVCRLIFASPEFQMM